MIRPPTTDDVPRTGSRGTSVIATTARVSLLDGFRVSVYGVHAGTTAVRPPHSVQRLIAHLCLRGRSVRGAIAGKLWPDVPEAHGRGSLRSALWRVQNGVPELVEVSGDAVTLAADVGVDVREFVDRAHAVLDAAIGLDRMEASAAALSGELLPGWYDDRVLLERERYRRLRVRCAHTTRSATRCSASSAYRRPARCRTWCPGRSCARPAVDAFPKASCRCVPCRLRWWSRGRSMRRRRAGGEVGR